MRTIPVMDQETYKRIIWSLDQARFHGRAPADQLNRDNLVWTKDRERQIRAETIRFILEELSQWTPAEFLRRRSKGLERSTPTDMYFCIREWLEDHLAYAQTGNDTRTPRRFSTNRPT